MAATLTADVSAHDSTRWPAATDLAVRPLGECRHAARHEPVLDEAGRVGIFFEPGALTWSLLTWGAYAYRVCGIFATWGGCGV